MKHFIANERARTNTKKRGGNYEFIPFDPASAESHYGLELLRKQVPHQSRMEQVFRNRERALDLIGEAARIRRSPILRKEAIETIRLSKVRLLHDIAFGDAKRVEFSTDGTLLTVSGLVPDERGKPNLSRVRVFSVESGALVGETEWSILSGFPAFSPIKALVAMPKGDYITALWNPLTGQETMQLLTGGVPLFSMDGAYLALGTVNEIVVYSMGAITAIGRRKGCLLVGFMDPPIPSCIKFAENSCGDMETGSVRQLQYQCIFRITVG